MSKYFVKVYTDEFNEKEWKDLKPEEIHFISFKGKLYDEVRHGKWTIEDVHQYKLAHGTTAYEPIYRCSCCGLITESYLRFDESIMPNDADFPKWCGNCGARMVEE